MNRLTLVTLIVGALFAVTHTTNETNHLYWYYPGLEYVMHFWGGVVIYLVLQTVLWLSLMPEKLRSYPGSSFFILAALMIGWEVFGIYRYGGFKPHYLFDTSLDLAFGILGCTLGWIIYRLMKKRTT